MRYLACIMFWILFILPGCSTVENFTRNPQRDFLRSRDYTKVLIEVITFDVLPPPTLSDLGYLKSKILQYCNKDQVEIIIDPPLDFRSSPTLFWTAPILSAFEFRHSRYMTVGDTIVLHVLYIPGFYAPDMVTRGLAYGDYAFCLFRSNMPQSHERSVLVHELGHLLGLVNCGTPNVNDHCEKDPNHRLHCNNQAKCVMYWSSPETQTPDFDDACKLDLLTNGGK